MDALAMLVQELLPGRAGADGLNQLHRHLPGAEEGQLGAGIGRFALVNHVHFVARARGRDFGHVDAQQRGPALCAGLDVLCDQRHLVLPHPVQ